MVEKVVHDSAESSPERGAAHVSSSVVIRTDPGFCFSGGTQRSSWKVALDPFAMFVSERAPVRLGPDLSSRDACLNELLHPTTHGVGFP